MGKTGTTSGFRDALFVGSTFGESGITVAVRLGFDDNSSLGVGETGGRAALPIFRSFVETAYQQGLLGPAPMFPPAVERDIDLYMVGASAPPPEVPVGVPEVPDGSVVGVADAGDDAPLVASRLARADSPTGDVMEIRR
jgi:penicillin-binding protein 1A